MPLGTGLSLREAIVLANANPGTDLITFAHGMGDAFEGGGTIYLTLGTELHIGSDITIEGDLDGDGTPDVTVDADSAMGMDDATSSVFLVDFGTSTIDGLVVTGGSSLIQGGGIRVIGVGSLALTNSLVTDNYSGLGGGGIVSFGTLTLTDTTVSDNVSALVAGGVYIGSGTATLTNVTISDNTTGLAGGGFANAGTSTLTNTTISGNSVASGTGGGGVYVYDGSITLTNTTISGNYAGGTGAGGGIGIVGGTATLNNSIVLGNDATSAPEISGGYTNTGGLSIVGGTPGDVFAAIDAGTPSGIGGLLADNGGRVQTIALKGDASNPALDAGDDMAAPAMDARGTARSDVFGVANNGTNISDLGAFEIVAETPSLIVTTSADVVDPFDNETSLREAIAFANDPTAGNMADGDADNDGFANDTITFAHGMGEAFEFGGTITLDMAVGQLEIASDVTIDGDLDSDGTPDVTVDAGSNSRVLMVSSGTATIGGLTIANGDAGSSDDGGGILVGSGATANLSNSTVTGNYAEYGGGIRVEGGGTLSLTNSTLSNNRANYGGGLDNRGTTTVTGSTVSGNTSYSTGGGGILSIGTLTLTNSTVSGNEAPNGGGLYVTGTTTLTNVTVANNYADNNGGGIYSYGTTLRLINSTVSGNYAVHTGGGFFVTGGGAVYLTNTIVLGNGADYAGVDGYTIYSAVHLNQAIINGYVAGYLTSAEVFAVIDGSSPSGTGGLLADNGGPVQTIALLRDAMNPALDQGADNVMGIPLTDARGYGRYDYPGTSGDVSTIDIGAFELGEAPSLIVTTDQDVVDPNDGLTSLREAIMFANDPNAGDMADGDADNDGFANDTITFAHGMGEAFENGGTIMLVGGQLEATAAVTIDGDVDGDGTPDVTIDADGASRILETSADTTLRGLVLTGGHTTGDTEQGGAVRATGSAALTVENSTVSGNSTMGNHASGGGIASDVGDLTLTDTTVSGNSTAGANAYGGGIFSQNGSVMLTNVTVSGNSTIGFSGQGGGILSYSGPATLTNSTVSGNSTAGMGATGGGIAVLYSSITLNNSIVLGNVTSGSNAGKNDVHYSGGLNINYSIVGDDDPYTAADVFADTYEIMDGNGMATGVYAGLLADNGGPVQTIALLGHEDNPALDAGDDMAAPAMDARGLPRFDLPGIANNGANTSDLGAFEIQTEVNVSPMAPATNSAVTDEDVPTGAVPIGATDINGDMLAYSLKPGFEPANGSVSFSGGNFTFIPDPDFNGADSFTILIDDGNGGKIIEQVVSVTILPVNDDPVAVDDNAVTPEDTAAVIAVLANDTDSDGPTLSVVSATSPAHGAVVVNPDDTITYTPDPDYFGPDGFDYDISDGAGGTDTGHVAITVLPVNDPPTAPATNMIVTDEDTPSAPVPIGAMDVDSSSFSYSIPLSAQPGRGSASFVGDAIVYTPDPDENGTDHFDIIVTDGDFAFVRQEVWVTINPVNDDPVANDDAAAADEDLPLDIAAADLLANDSDIDGDVLTVTGVSGATNGTAVLMGSTVTFTPAPGFFGIAGFDYAISDGNGGTDSAHVTVTVAEVVGNHPPVVTPDAQDLATIEDTPLVFSVMASDADDDPLSITPGTPANGMVMDNGDGTFTYTPNPGFSGTDMFTMLVSDGNGGTDEQTITVAVKDIPEGLDWRLFAGDGWAGAVGGTGQVIGTSGFQSVKVLDLPGTVSFDPSFNGGEDFVCVTGNAADWSIVRSGSTAILFDGDTCVVIPVGSEGLAIGFDDGNRTLFYDTEAESLWLGTQEVTGTLAQVMAAPDGAAIPPGEDAAALARLYFAEGGSAAAGGHLDVIGTNGAEQLTLLFGDASLGPSFNIGNDMLILDQPTSDFSAARSGSLALFDSATTDVSIPVGSAGMDIAFTNTTASLAYDAMANAVFIGTQMIDMTPMPLTFA